MSAMLAMSGSSKGRRLRAPRSGTCGSWPRSSFVAGLSRAAEAWPKMDIAYLIDLDCHFSLLRLFACYTACFSGGGSCKQCRSLMSERKSVRKRGASTALPGMSWHRHCHQWALRGYWMLGFEAIASQPVNISHSIWNDDIYYIHYIYYIILLLYIYIYIIYIYIIYII